MIRVKHSDVGALSSLFSGCTGSPSLEQALKFVWVEGCYVKILHEQQLLDVLFKDRHCFVDGLWSLLAMSSSMLFFMHVDRA